MRCKSVAYGGEGVCETESGRIVFVPFALPGQVLDAKITDMKKRYARGRLVCTVHPSSDAVVPPCPHFGSCGGCSLQHSSYASQLSYKRGWVVDALTRVGGLNADAVRSAVQSTLGVPSGSQEYGFRNRMDFCIASSTKGPVLGLRSAASSKARVPIGKCLLQPSHAQAALEAVNGGFQAAKEVDWADLISHVSIRSATDARDSEQTLLAFYVAHGSRKSAKKHLLTLVPYFAEQIPHLVGVCLVTTRSSYRTLGAGSRLECLWGRDHLTQVLGPASLAVPAASFSQTNPAQAHALVALLRREAVLRPGDTLLDLYCGSGALGLALLAGAGPEVDLWGVERDRAAVRSAGENARANGLERRARFACASADDVRVDRRSGLLKIVEILEEEERGKGGGGEEAREGNLKTEVERGGDLGKETTSSMPFDSIAPRPTPASLGRLAFGRVARPDPATTARKALLPKATRSRMVLHAPEPSIVIVDPPRGGLDAAVVRLLRSLRGARRLLYVSCDASTAARDLARLGEELGDSKLTSWRLVRAAPVDMYPQTGHVEVVMTLEPENEVGE